MFKTGVVVGAISALFTALFAVMVTPYCGLCAGILAGVAAGYLTGEFQKPENSKKAITLGAIAGAIAGGVSILGSLLAAVINGLLVDPADVAAMGDVLGVTMSADTTTIWVGELFSAGCVGFLNVVIGAGLGAAGGALWHKIMGKKSRPN